jgi:hypothetical protein
MLILVAAVLGGAYGGWLARKRAGNGKDIAQYAAVFAIAGALIGLLLTIIVARSL